MSDSQRRIFDALLEAEIDRLPDALRELLEETPVVVEDRPSRDDLAELEPDGEPGGDVLGLHHGVPLTERSVEAPHRMPDRIMLYREPLWRMAGGQRDRLVEQIHITLLHEIGHHFGLDEDDLERAGYG